MSNFNPADLEKLKKDIENNIVTILGNDSEHVRDDILYNGLAYSVRARLLERWIKGQRSYYEKNRKRVYYLSMEFLPGRFLMNYINNMDIKDVCEEAVKDSNTSLEDLEGIEFDPGLGNGGLGRLASCYLDSMACLNIPGYGYGIRYDYGLFYQNIVNGEQVEETDNWMAGGNPWEVKRSGYHYTINFYGHTEAYTDVNGQLRQRWVHTEQVGAVACDFFIPAYGNNNVLNMRLWAAESTRDIDLEYFNKGQYIEAMTAKVLTENISKVLYPGDELVEGKELRLKQQYFLVAATFQDILRRFKKEKLPFSELPKHVAIQLNDTHPSISIPELMRLLVDEEKLPWNEAWAICQNTFAYTNHTILPEALECWSVDLLGRVLPRHIEIIFEINKRFMIELEMTYPGNNDIKSKLSIIQGYHNKVINMAHLSIVGSKKVNGVAALHSKILKERLFKDFSDHYPNKFINITNGITPRLWLFQSNPLLTDLISSVIGVGWKNNFEELEKLVPFAEDISFREKWQAVKQKNKEKLAIYFKKRFDLHIKIDTLFDVQTKRIHEYKRQILNLFHVITLYNRIKANPQGYNEVPRTIIFGGKAAPGYYMAKLIIKLINSVAGFINNDPEVNKHLTLFFMPNYCVSRATKLIPAADLSEQISTAGLEASGTGNMKFALNGALTIGTLDGANIEIMEEVGRENMFIFGLKVEEIEDLKSRGYNPYVYYQNDPDLMKVINMINSGYFYPEDPDVFKPLINNFLHHGDKYFVLADYSDYIQTQDSVGKVYKDQDEWAKRSILTTARMSKFSSDRSVREYAEKIWNV